MRKFILLTLSRAEREDRKGIDKAEILGRVVRCFQCISVVVVREEHQNEGNHFHVGIKKTNARKNNATKVLRTLNLRAHKLMSLFIKPGPQSYNILSKVIRNLGDETLEKMKEIVHARQGHREKPGKKCSFKS